MTTRVLIMAGGTGGHVFPALAVAEELKSRAVDVSWMGTEKGIEAKLVPAAGYPISYISVHGLRGNGILGWLLAPFQLLRAVFEALTILKQIKPDVVLGLGGFASGPGGIAAWILRKPLAIHEQNAIPGLTNRILAKFAKKVMEGFPQSFVTSVGAECVGNPVRTSIEIIVTPEFRLAEREGRARILVLGGSLGARKLNMVIPEAMALIDEQQRPEIIHQCGSRHSQECIETYEEANISAQVEPFIDDMAKVYAWADLVICRAGALTVAELSAAGVGALFIPFPYAVDDHQTFNALSFVSAGAGKIITEKVLTAELLADEIKQFSGDHELLLAMAKAARSQVKLGSAKVIADACLELVHG